MSWKIVTTNYKCFYRFSVANVECCGYGKCAAPYTDKPCTEATCPLKAMEGEGDEKG